MSVATCQYANSCVICPLDRSHQGQNVSPASCVGSLSAHVHLILPMQVSPSFFDAPGAALAHLPGSEATQPLDLCLTIAFCNCCSFKVSPCCLGVLPQSMPSLHTPIAYKSVSLGTWHQSSAEDLAQEVLALLHPPELDFCAGWSGCMSSYPSILYIVCTTLLLELVWIAINDQS